MEQPATPQAPFTYFLAYEIEEPGLFGRKDVGSTVFESMHQPIIAYAAKRQEVLAQYKEGSIFTALSYSRL